MKEAKYTFVSVSTPKEGMLNELITLAEGPTKRMDPKVKGLLAYQVSVDRVQNSVVVWATFDSKETLYNFLETEKGKDDHGENDSMECIETFAMFDLEPTSQRLTPKV